MAALEAAMHAKMAVAPAFAFDCTDRGENKGILYLWHLGLLVSKLFTWDEVISTDMKVIDSYISYSIGGLTNYLTMP